MRNSVNCAVNKSHGLEMCQPLNVRKKREDGCTKTVRILMHNSVEHSVEIRRSVFRRREAAINTSIV